MRKALQLVAPKVRIDWASANEDPVQRYIFEWVTEEPVPRLYQFANAKYVTPLTSNDSTSRAKSVVSVWNSANDDPSQR